MVVKKVLVQTITADTLKVGNNRTLYLFNEDTKIILPIEIDDFGAQSIIEAQENKLTPRPNIHNTLARIITCLNATVEGAIVYKHQNGIFYTYIRLLNEDCKTLDIDAKLTDAIAIALRFKKPIYIDEEILEKAGIKVTKELLHL